MKRPVIALLLSLLASTPVMRAASTHEVLTASDSGVTIRLFTPMKFAPQFGFLPVRVTVENGSSANGTWRVNLRAGDAALFPGAIVAGFTLSVPAGQTKEEWFYAPLAVPGIVAALILDPKAPPQGPIVWAPPPASPAGQAAAQASQPTPPGRGGSAAAPAPVAAPVLPPSAIAALEAEATAVLKPTGLLDLPWGVTESVSTANGVVTFEQSGGAEALVKPPAGSLPPGVLVNLHPGIGPGQAIRTVTYINPAELAAASAQPSSRADAYRKAVTRNTLALWRHGYLRKSGAIQSTNPSSFADRDGVVTTTVAESGPASLLAQPLPEALPPDTLVSVTPGAVPPGGVIRKFTVTTVVPAVADDPMNARPFSAVLGAADPGLILAQVTGPGIDREVWTDLSSGLDGEVQPMPPVVVPPKSEDILRERLALGNLRAPPTVTAVDPASLPADWRLWSAMHAVVIRTEEYNRLPADHRGALHRWVSLGGRLVLATDSEDGFGPTTRLGAGVITTLPGQLAYVPPSETSRQLGLPVPSVSLPARAALAREAESVTEFGAGERSDTRWLVYVLVGFAITAGPLNLLFFAPAGRRHRVLVTMPLIALAGAAVMATGIVLRTGLGGEGNRASVVALVPELGGAAVFQDQVSRTGILTSGRFDLADDTMLAAVPLEIGESRSGDTLLERAGGEAGGDWFRSRSYQAYHLRRFVSAPGRLEIAGASGETAPTVTSSLPAALQDFAWVDDRDRVWTASEVAPGAAVTLTRAPDGTWPRLQAKGSKALGEIFAAAANREPGRWAARGTGSAVAPIPTLASIRWRNSEIFVTGLTPSSDWAKVPAE